MPNPVSWNAGMYNMRTVCTLQRAIIHPPQHANIIFKLFFIQIRLFPHLWTLHECNRQALEHIRAFVCSTFSCDGHPFVSFYVCASAGRMYAQRIGIENCVAFFFCDVTFYNYIIGILEIVYICSKFEKEMPRDVETSEHMSFYHYSRWLSAAIRYTTNSGIGGISQSSNRIDFSSNCAQIPFLHIIGFLHSTILPYILNDTNLLVYHMQCILMNVILRVPRFFCFNFECVNKNEIWFWYRYVRIYMGIAISGKEQHTHIL